LCGLVLVVGCERSNGTTEQAVAADWSLPAEAQPRLPTVKLWLGAEKMTAEVARTARQVQTGMMFRKSMGEDEGMIFGLGEPRQASFWMKNCSVPLSVAYLDPEGVILEIHKLEPHNTNSVVSTSHNVLFALETPQGWFDLHNVRTGMLVRTEQGSLLDLYRGR